MPKFSNVGELIEDYMQDEIVSMNNPTCIKCNECCGMLTMLTDEEFSNLKRFIKKDKRGKFLYERGLSLILDYLAKGTVYWMCPFSWNYKCSIYNRRPIMCREFHCDDPEHSKQFRDVHEKAHTHYIGELFDIKNLMRMCLPK